MNKKVLLTIASLSIAAPWAQAQSPVFSDDFNSTTKNAAWTIGGGYFLNGTTMLVSTFGGAWGEIASGNGMAGLTAPSGQVSFTVATDGVNPLGGHFNVGSTSHYTQQQMAGIDFAVSGAGSYEIVWNNTGSNLTYSTVGGKSGNLAGNNNFIVFINGSLWGSDPQTGGATTFTAGDGTAANAFGFWHSIANETAVIDDFKIYSTLNGTPPPPSLTPKFSDDFNSTTKNAAWTIGGGYFLNGSTLLVTTFGGTWGEIASGSGVVGLTAPSGQVSFTVATDGVNPLGGHFNVGSTSHYTQQQMAGVDFGVSGVGSYEIVWNNTGSNLTYSTVGGKSGNLAGNNNFLVFINGSLWGSDPQTGGATTFTAGDGTAANAFGFWHSIANETAVIDDFKIYSTLNGTSAPPPPSAYLVYDNFDAPTLNPTVWNTGGAYFLDTGAQRLVLSGFGQNWGEIGDGTGASGLNSAIGYASFTVSSNDPAPLGFNFIIENDVHVHTDHALLNIDFSAPNAGAGTYEILWNNSGTDRPFIMPLSGWSGTIGGNWAVWIVNGDTTNANWVATTNAPGVLLGEPANRFGFWQWESPVVGKTAVIDNVRIATTLTPGVAACAAPTLSLVRNGTNVDLSWPSATGCTYQLRSKTTLTGGWSDLYAPVAGDGTTKTLPVPATGPEQYFQLVVQ